jgi:tRNA (mo5U34)-methyltransferase
VSSVSVPNSKSSPETVTITFAQLIDASQNTLHQIAETSGTLRVKVTFDEIQKIDSVATLLHDAGFPFTEEKFEADGIYLVAQALGGPATDVRNPDDVSQYLARSNQFRDKLNSAKQTSAPHEFWYPYDSLDNVAHFNNLLTGSNRLISHLVGNGAVLDVGCADGDVAFFLESEGFTVDAIDYGPTSFNNMEGICLLHDALESKVSIYEVDLDENFLLPRNTYGLTLFLGTLNRLKNPFSAMDTLAKRTKWCIISTRVTRNSQRGESIEHIPAAYLLDPAECNNDNSNYWIFTHVGLRRLFERSNWEIEDYLAAGDTQASNPTSPDHEEAAFALLRSKLV